MRSIEEIEVELADYRRINGFVSVTLHEELVLVAITLRDHNERLKQALIDKVTEPARTPLERTEDVQEAMELVHPLQLVQ